jgi:hypothetical protein
VKFASFVWIASGLLCLLLSVKAQKTSADSSKPALHAAHAAQLGAIENGNYRNSFFEFRYAVPYGWVERTEQMRDSSTDPDKSLLLLAVFERPPEAQGSSVNSAVVITAESTSAYPGLKTAADYFVPLADVATGKGFTAVNEPYYFSVGTKKVVRGDFSKKVADFTMYQSSIVTLEKGYFVSFTFLGGGEDEVNEVIEKLSFSGTAAKKARGTK